MVSYPGKWPPRRMDDQLLRDKLFMRDKSQEGPWEE